MLRTNNIYISKWFETISLDWMLKEKVFRIVFCGEKFLKVEFLAKNMIVYTRTSPDNFKNKRNQLRKESADFFY
jgi:hypothetical protein